MIRIIATKCLTQLLTATGFYLCGKTKSFEEDKSRGGELFEHEAFVVWN
jgi:hypothetical protein